MNRSWALNAIAWPWASGLRTLGGGSLQIPALLIAGGVVSVTLTLVLWLQIADHRRMEFEWVAQDRSRALKKGVDDTLNAVQSVADLLRVDPDIGQDEFLLFAGSLRERFKPIHSLEWLPRASIGDLMQGAVGGAPGDSERGPGSTPMIGRLWDGSGASHDWVADATMGGLLERAVSTGEVTISGRVPLDPDAASYGILVMVPVPARMSPAHPVRQSVSTHQVSGVVIGVLNLVDLADAAVRVLEPRGVECLLRDQSAPPRESFLDFYASRLEPEVMLEDGEPLGWSLPDAQHVTEDYRIADRLWSITCARTPHYRSAVGLTQGPWIVFGASLALTMLTALFVQSLRHQVQVRLGVERDLRASEQQLRILFSQSPDIMMTVNARGRIIMVNRSWPKAPQESAVGHNSAKILPKGLRKWYRNALREVFRSGAPEHFQYSEADSSYWEVRIVPLRTEHGVSSAMVIATDVTERRLLEVQAIRSARLATLGVLSASVAHEINNPNNAIQFNASLLKRSFDDILPLLRRERENQGDFLVGGVPVAQAIDGMPRMLSALARNAQRIQGIVSNLKRMARHDPGEYGAEVDLGKVLRSAYSILQHQIANHTDDCALVLPRTVVLIRGNAQQLEQVFVNLLLNALQSLSDRVARVWITVEIAEGDDRVRVGIVDQGKGIEDDDLTRIFDPFFTTRTDDGGTGLGLSITRRILQNHGGGIDIESVQGIGTEVAVYLPIVSATENLTGDQRRG